MKAHLVDFDLRVRIVMDEQWPEDVVIAHAADKLKRLPLSDIIENCVSVKLDIEVPYDPKHDKPIEP